VGSGQAYKYRLLYLFDHLAIINPPPGKENIISQFIKSIKKVKFYWMLLIFFISFILILNIYYLFNTATNEGPWQSHYERIATTTIKGNDVVIHNFRRARYDKNGTIKNLNWSDRTVNLDKLEKIWYGISVFASPGLAHTFLSFDFGENDPVVISVEARMRPEQQYHPLKGALDNYHLIYVIADEQDIIGVRTHKRSEDVYFMPINVSKERSQKMFLDMVNRANHLETLPEFYNTFTSNCTNSIMKNTKLRPWQYYFDPRIILSGYSDRIAYQYGILDQNFTQQVIREASRIKITDFTDEDPEFHNKIRASYYNKLEDDSEIVTIE